MGLFGNYGKEGALGIGQNINYGPGITPATITGRASDAFVERQQAAEREAQLRQLDHPTGIPLQDVDGISMPQGQGSRGVFETVMGEPKRDSEVPSDPPKEEPKAAPVPDPATDPAAAVASMTSNRSVGLGNAVGYDDTMPEMPDQTQIIGQAIANEGKQVTLREIETPNWYEDDSFYEGMLSFGLNLLSGNDWAQSFNQGASVFQNSKALEKRQVWAQDLLAQGYDAHEVEAWVRTGDNKALSDPFEKKMKEQAFALGQQQLTSAMRENDPAMIKYKQDMERWKLQQEAGDRKFDRWAKMEGLNIQRSNAAREAELTSMKIKQLQDPNANWRGSGPDGRPLTAVQTDAEGNRRSVIESPQGWVDFTTRQPIDPRQGEIQTEYISKDEAALGKAQTLKFNESRQEADDLSANVSMGLEQARDFYSGDIAPWNLYQYAPRTAESELAGKMQTARSGLAVTNYSTMKGVAGASAKTEAALEASIPSINASPSEKKAWVQRKINYDVSVLKNTILEQRRRYGDGGVSQSLMDTYRKAIQAQKSM